MTPSNRYSPSAPFGVKRALASVTSPAVFITVLALLLLVVAACTGDDDGTPSGSDTASPSSSLPATASPSPTDSGDGEGNGGGDGNGQANPTPGNTGSGTATIDGVQYDFSVSTCSVQPDFAIVLGFGTGPDGNPLIGTASWAELDFRGVPDSFEVGIGVNAPSLLSVPEKVFKLGFSVVESTVDSVEIDLSGFDLTASGMFVDLQAPESPPVPGTFSVSCG